MQKSWSHLVSFEDASLVVRLLRLRLGKTCGNAIFISSLILFQVGSCGGGKLILVSFSRIASETFVWRVWWRARRFALSVDLVISSPLPTSGVGMVRSPDSEESVLRLWGWSGTITRLDLILPRLRAVLPCIQGCIRHNFLLHCGTHFKSSSINAPLLSQLCVGHLFVIDLYFFPPRLSWSGQSLI